MKIRSIRFLNLNSLKGEHEINFDASPLIDSGLFAITGPTGAGKTTILDAITLGLYGCVNRHSNDLAGQIMTRHTAECFSEVTFEAHNEVYRAKWQVYRSRRKPDGNLQQHTMELCRVADGKIFDLKSKEVPGKVSELCGLDYSQFLRSVMLSQGEFTRFLKASENERSELLERITDTGIYTDISRQAYRRAATEKNALQLLRQEMSGQNLLAPELLAEYETSLENYRLEEATFKQVRAETETQIAWLKNLEKLAEKQTQTQIALAELQENAARYQPEFARLAQHKIALNFRPDLVKLEREELHLAGLNQQLEQVQVRLPDLLQQVKTFQERELAGKTVHEQAEKLLQASVPVLDEVMRRDAEINSLRQQFLKNKEAFQQANLAFENDKTAGQQQQQTVADLQQKLTDLNAWLQTHAAEKALGSELHIFERYLEDLAERSRVTQIREQEKQAATQNEKIAREQAENLAQKLHGLELEKQNLLARSGEITQALQTLLTGTTENKLETALLQLPSRLNGLEKLLKISQQHGTLAEKAGKIQAYLKAENDRLAQLHQAEKELTLKLEEARKMLQQYQEILEFQLQVQNYEAARQQLQPNCECPLCGALEHPFVTGKKPQLTNATGQRNQQQKTVAELEQNRSKVLTELTALQAKLQSAETAQEETKELTATLLTEFNSLAQTLTAGFSIAEANQIEEAMLAEQVKLGQMRRLAENLKITKQQSSELAEKQFRVQEALLTENARHEQAWERIETAVSNRQQAEKELAELQAQVQKLVVNAGSFAARFGFTFTPENGNVLGQEFRKLAQAFSENTEALQQTRLTLAEAEGRLEKILAARQEREQHLGALKEKLTGEHQELNALKTQREEIFGFKNPVEERAALTASCEEKKAALENLKLALQQASENLKLAEVRQEQLVLETGTAQRDIQAITTALVQKLEAAKLGSIENFRQLFLPDEEAARLSGLELQFDKILTETRQTLADTAAELKLEMAKALTAETVEFLTEKLLENDQKISGINQQIGSISQILKRETELRDKHRELAERINLQQKEAARWEQLSELIGSESGKKFSKFAQGLTLAKLVTLANRHLAKLNDRYQLQKTPTADLELQMIDTYQADAIRSVNTLSGGESFLVSLALALGLSDLASHKTQIDSLFIDEGFGTLDAETLDVAVTALENLQASGKMIGIISHVEALKERISTQIQVTKLSGGISKIRVSAYSYDSIFE